MRHTRREFLVQVSGAVVATRALIACGDDTSEPSPTPIPTPDAGEFPGPVGNCVRNGADAMIVANHGHILMVPAADVLAGTPRVYNIQGAADHPHTISVTADLMELLQRDSEVVVESSIDGSDDFPLHSHTVRLICEMA